MDVISGPAANCKCLPMCRKRAKMNKTRQGNPLAGTTQVSVPRTNEHRLRALLLSAAAITVLTLLIFIYASYVKGLFGLELNEIGDAIAGFASFLAFLWLIVTVVLQYSELRLQRQEIADLRAASEDQAKTLRMTNRVHTLTLLRSKQEDIAPYLKQSVKTNATIIADFLGEILDFQHSKEFMAQPQEGLGYVYGYFILEDHVDGRNKLKDVIISANLRKDFDYDAFVKLDSLVANMEAIWDVIKPIWILCKQAEATEEYFAWQTFMGLRWYSEHYPVIRSLVHELRIIVSSGTIGSDIQRLIAGSVLEYEEKELKAGRRSPAFNYSSSDGDPDADLPAGGAGEMGVINN